MERPASSGSRVRAVEHASNDREEEKSIEAVENGGIGKNEGGGAREGADEERLGTWNRFVFFKFF